MPTTKAQQDHYLRNADRYKRQAKLGKKKIIEEMRRIKTRSPCQDCKNFFPAECMDFDHRENEKKAGNVSALAVTGSIKRMLEEIKKCDLVCANCHRIRTAKRIRENGRLSSQMADDAVMDLFRWAEE